MDRARTSLVRVSLLAAVLAGALACDSDGDLVGYATPADADSGGVAFGDSGTPAEDSDAASDTPATPSAEVAAGEDAVSPSDAPATAEDTGGGVADAGGGEPDAPGLPQDAGSGDAAGDVPATCAQVCFSWNPRPEPPAPATPGTPTPITWDECNLSGVDRGACPAGFVCGSDTTVDLGVLIMTFPTCEGPSPGGVYEVELDVASPVPPAETVFVVLRLTLDGQPWPAGSGSVGRLTVRHLATNARVRTDLPASGEPLSLRLARGEHEITVALTPEDKAAHPTVTRTGTLVVAASGEATLPLEGHTLDLSVSHQGSPVAALAAGERMSIVLTGAHGQVVVLSYEEGDLPGARLMLDPDRYEAAVIVATGTSSTLPAGRVVLAEPRELDARGTSSWALDLRSVEISGSVRVDGQDLPATANAGDVVLVSHDGLSYVDVEVGGARPARFALRVFPGAYAVTYDTQYTTMDGVPEGVVLVHDGPLPDGALDIDVTTIEVSGEVRRNGAPPPESYPRGRVIYAAGTFGSGTTFSLPSTGPATFSGRVFAGRYDVKVSSSTGFALPQKAWTVAAGHVATSVHQVFDLAAHELRVQLTHRGSRPPDAVGDDVYERGALVATAADAPDYAPGTSFPVDGVMEAALLLPAGAWRLRYHNVSGRYDGVPLGSHDLGEIALSSDTTRTFDLPSVGLRLHLSQGGAALPDAAPGSNRGAVFFSDWLSNVPFSLPDTGDVLLEKRLYPGIYDIGRRCYAASDCDQRGAAEEWYVLVSGIRLD